MDSNVNDGWCREALLHGGLCLLWGRWQGELEEVAFESVSGALMHMCACMCMLSCVRLFATPWTVALQFLWPFSSPGYLLPPRD